MRAAGAAQIVVARRGAVLVAGVGGHKVAKALASALAAVVEQAEVSVAKNTFALEWIVRYWRSRGLALAERGAARANVCRAASPVNRQRCEVRLNLIPFRRDVLAEAASTKPSLLGDDLNDAGRRVGTVERRRRRSFHDFDALDVVGTEVVERGDRLAAESLESVSAAADGDIVALAAERANAIDEDERRIREGDGCRAANVDA